MTPLHRPLDLFLFLPGDSASHLPPHHALPAHHSIELRPNRINTLGLGARRPVQLSQELRRARNSKHSRVETIHVATSRKRLLCPTSCQSKIASSYSHEISNFSLERRAHAISAVSLVGGCSALRNFPSDRDAHRVGDNVYVRCLRISQHSLNESSDLKDIGLTMVVQRSIKYVCCTPCRSIQLSLCVPLRAEVNGQISEASLPGRIRSLAISETDIAVPMNKDDWSLDDLLAAGGLPSKSCALDVWAIEAPNGVIYLNLSLLLSLRN